MEAAEADVERSSDEIRQQLELYHDQLRQVEELIVTDPSSEHYQKLKNDLQEVIRLTSDLLAIEANDSAYGAVQSEHTDGFAVGSRVEAVLEEHWMPAIVREVKDGGEQFSVQFLNHEEISTVPAIGVRQIEHAAPVLDPNTIAPGLEVLCKWPNDGLYYSATVECSTFNHTQSLTYRVTFSEYGNVEEVPLEYVANKNANVKHLLAGSGAASKAKGKGGTKRSAAGATEETELVIPEHLKIKPTDTDKEKERKRKKIKAIKNKIRIKEQEDERAEKQNDWQKFMNKGKNRAAGFLTAKRKDSIFASPEAVDGKVGVTGSGHGMTDFDKRKKFKLSLTR